MLSPAQKQRLQNILLLVGLGLVLYYGLVFRPVSQRAADLDAPLVSVWHQLVKANLEHSAVEGLDLEKIEASLEQVRSSFQELEEAARTVSERIGFDPEVQAKLHQPLQLVQFQNERQQIIEDLTRMARRQKVNLAPAVLENFPEYTAEQRQPALLWAQLAVLHHLLATAILCNIPGIQSVELLPLQTHRPGGASSTLHQIPVQLELTGPMPAAAQFLLSLPLRAEEIKEMGLPETLPSKPALFLDEILLRKNSAEKADEVHLSLKISGFAYRE
jgi:hypothetical protein